MTDFLCYLVTVYYQEHNELITCALKVHADYVTRDMCEYPMEPESREMFQKLLPMHVRSCGPIVKIEDIFEVHEVKG